MARHDTAPRLKAGDPFPDLVLDSGEGAVPLRDRWANSSLVIAFMRHFG